MLRTKSLPLSGKKLEYLCLFLSIVFQCAAYVAMKYAANGRNGGGDSGFLLRVLSNPYYWLSLFFLALQAIVWPLALRKLPLTFAYAATLMLYPLLLASSYLFFRESVSLRNLIGVVVIAAGLMLFVKSGK